MKIEDMSFESPFFDPWVGLNYGTKGRRRVMVVGASHYCDKCAVCEMGKCPVSRKSLTQDVVKDYLNVERGEYEPWMGTYTKFTNSIYGYGASQEEREYFWNGIIFMNYLQRSEGVDANEKHDEYFCDDRHFQAFCSVVRKHRPEVVIVWGGRVWNAINGHMRDNKEMETVIASDGWSSDVGIGDLKFKLLSVYHPSYIQYQTADDPHERFVKFGCDACGLYNVTPRREMIESVRQLAKDRGCESKCRIVYVSGERQLEVASEDKHNLAQPWLACGIPAAYRDSSDGKTIDCFACIVEQCGVYEVGLRRSPESEQPFGDGDDVWWLQWDRGMSCYANNLEEAMRQLKSVVENPKVTFK